MSDQHTVIAVNYHRLGPIDPDNPFHRLHTVPHQVFAQHLEQMQARGPIVSPEQVRDGQGLGPLNFVVCFDDVPLSALDGIQTMRTAGLPVTLSVCGQLADQGWGTRDQVYAITRYAPPEQLHAALRRVLPHLAQGPEEPSFYHLTKRADVDPDLVRTELIDPLFRTVQTQAGPYFAQRAYLSWQQIQVLAADPQVTLANHTRSHDNLAALSTTHLHAEIHASHARFTDQTGRPARYFTMPFGQMLPDLALDSLQPLLELGYHGTLWVGPGAITVRRPFRRQLLHLPRLHADTTSDGFTAQLDQAHQMRHVPALWQIPLPPRRRPVTIVAASDPAPVLLLEQLMRQGKDYACDPAFYRYQFTDNPAKGDRPDYYAVKDGARLQATAYNFHAAFAVEGHRVPGVYLSSWRKLPGSHPAAAGQLLHRMTTREPIVGVYDPNPQVHTAFTGWHRAAVHRLTLPVPDRPPALPDGYTSHATSHFPASAETLCRNSAAAARFTVDRDARYQRWRHSAYPLATATYLLVHHDGQPAALAVVLRTDHDLAVADFHTRTTRDHPALLRAVLVFAALAGAETVPWETSSTTLARCATEQHNATDTPFSNFYHLNPALLAQHGVRAGLSERWSRLPLHETASTSDVLLR